MRWVRCPPRGLKGHAAHQVSRCSHPEFSCPPDLPSTHLFGVPAAPVSQQPATFVLTKIFLFLELDTSHVPCKFFRQGACQAGNACPFSHDLGSAAETVCKYFAKVRDPKPSPLLCLPDDACVRLPTLTEGS